MASLSVWLRQHYALLLPGGRLWMWAKDPLCWHLLMNANVPWHQHGSSAALGWWLPPWNTVKAQLNRPYQPLQGVLLWCLKPIQSTDLCTRPADTSPWAGTGIYTVQCHRVTCPAPIICQAAIQAQLSRVRDVDITCTTLRFTIAITDHYAI